MEGVPVVRRADQDHIDVFVVENLAGIAKFHGGWSQLPGGFEGRLVVLAEPDIALGDCRIEWADGGVKRDSAATQAAIADAVARYIAGRRGETHTSEMPKSETPKSETPTRPQP